MIISHIHVFYVQVDGVFSIVVPVTGKRFTGRDRNKEGPVDAMNLREVRGMGL